MICSFGTEKDEHSSYNADYPDEVLAPTYLYLLGLGGYERLEEPLSTLLLDLG